MKSEKKKLKKNVREISKFPFFFFKCSIFDFSDFFLILIFSFFLQKSKITFRHDKKYVSSNFCVCVLSYVSTIPKMYSEHPQYYQDIDTICATKSGISREIMHRIGRVLTGTSTIFKVTESKI